MIVIGLLSALACKSDIGFEGTLVGNPGRGVASPAENENMRYSEGTGRLSSIEYTEEQGNFIDSSSQSEILDLDVNLLDPNSSFPLLLGNWSGIRLNFEQLSLKGEGSLPFELELNDVSLTIGTEEQGLVLLESEAYYVEMGQKNWLTNEQLSELDDTLIDASHPFFSAIRDQFASESAIYVDEDQDGELSEAERESNLIASGAARDDHLNSGDEEPGISDSEDD